jgi:hypothetical protein
MADSGADILNRHHVMNRQWLSLQQCRSSDPPLFERGRPLFSRPFDFDWLDDGEYRTPDRRAAHSLPNPEILAASARMFAGAMPAWHPQSDAYALSDWEDDDAMKDVDVDTDCRGNDGTAFPEWASGRSLESAVSKQNPNDGELIFRTMARRCDLVEMFGTSRFEYYQRRNRLKSCVC